MYSNFKQLICLGRGIVLAMSAITLTLHASCTALGTLRKALVLSSSKEASKSSADRWSRISNSAKYLHVETGLDIALHSVTLMFARLACLQWQIAVLLFMAIANERQEIGLAYPLAPHRASQGTQHLSSLPDRNLPG